MDYKDIERLLERYWRCETSLEEEARLRNFFVKGEVPPHLLRYKDLFTYQWAQREAGLGEDFDNRVLSRVEAPVVKAKRLTIVGRFMPLFKAVAVIAVVLMLGNVAQRSFTVNESGILAADTIGKQVTVPSVAISDDAQAERALADSLSKVKRPEVLKK